MIYCARLQGILYTAVCLISKGKLHIFKVNIEVSQSLVEVMVPYLYPEHKTSASLTLGCDSNLKWVIYGLHASAGGDGHHVEGVDDLVVEYDHEAEDEEH